MKQLTAISLVVLVLLSTTITQIPGAFAQINIGSTSSATKILIGIQFDQTCLTLFKINQTCNGMTYKTIKPLDNTNQYISGKWVSFPYYHRALPQVKNAWVSYDVPYVVMVDPDPDFTTRAYMIIVKGDHFTTINKDEVVTNGTRYVYNDRYVQLPSCDNALVYADIKLINDTVQYLENGCTKTNINTQKAITDKPIPFSMNNPSSSLHQQTYLKTIFNGHSIFSQNYTAGGLGPGNCINKKCPYTDPYKKPGW